LLSACGTCIASQVNLSDTLISSMPRRDTYFLQPMEN